MKATMWIVGVLLAVIIAIGIASTAISSRITRDYTQQLSMAEESIRGNDWEKARLTVESMANEWEEVCQWLQFWVNHEDTDDVTLAMERLAAAIEVQSTPLSLLAGAELGESLRHIHHRDALRLGNIL